MNKIIFRCAYFTVKLRDVAIIMGIVLLCFIGLKSCDSNTEKEEKIDNICVFTKENMNEFNTLISRADICSTLWFEDLDSYISRIEDQNKYIEKKQGSSYETLLEKQIQLLESIKLFEQEQSETSIVKLEKVFDKYMQYYNDSCDKEK